MLFITNFSDRFGILVVLRGGDAAGACEGELGRSVHQRFSVSSELSCAFEGERRMEAFRKIYPSEFYKKFLVQNVRPDGRALQKVRRTTVSVGT